MLGAMDYELLEGAACAGSDLTARLLAELASATARLDDAERRLRNAAICGIRPAAALRAEHVLCRRYVASLQQMLADIPPFEGGSYVASA
jgi:hypothetical protein